MSYQDRQRRIDLPQTPTASDMARVLEHVTGRFPDQREISDLQQQLNVPQSSYAPGGETGNRNRNRTVIH